MPFLRFSRDKRGYEHTYLVQATNRRGKPIRPRILYWYRTPPGVKLGRVPFDEEVRRTLEAQNPGITFDWDALASTPFPSQEPEFWRERRKAERAAKQARREEESTDAAEAADADGNDTLGASEPPVDPVEPTASALPLLDIESAVVGEPLAAAATESLAAPGPDAPPTDGAPRKRRRRGGRRRRGRQASDGADGTAASASDQGGEPNDGEPARDDDPSESTDSASEEQE